MLDPFLDARDFKRVGTLEFRVCAARPVSTGLSSLTALRQNDMLSFSPEPASLLAVFVAEDDAIDSAGALIGRTVY